MRFLFGCAVLLVLIGAFALHWGLGLIALGIGIWVFING
jgi:hypothetical protein